MKLYGAIRVWSKTVLRPALFRAIGWRRFERSADATLALIIGILCVVPAFYVFVIYTPWLEIRRLPTILANALPDEAIDIEKPVLYQLKHTALYAAITVTAQCFLGVFAALAIYELRSRRLRALYSALLIAPYAVPSFAAVLGWRLLTAEKTWIAARAVPLLHLRSPDLLADATGGFAVLCVVSIWQFFPFVFFFSYGALLTVPRSARLSAAIDGLTGVQRLIVLYAPRLLPVLLAAFLLRFLFMFTKYDTAALLGGDAGAAGARILPVAIYETLVKASTSSKATNALLGIVSVGTALLAAFCSFASSWTEHRRTPLWLLQKWHKCNVLYMIILRTTLVVVPTFVILPLLALLTGSFVHGTALDRGLPSIAEIVHERTVANYSMLWDRLRSNDLLTPLGNTLICISVAALMSCFLGAYFGYRSARYFTRKRWLFNALILILYAVPPITLIFPFGVAAKSVGMSGILLVSLATAAFVLPFCLRLSADYFALVPAQLDNTAAADGAKPLQALVAIYVPKLRAQLGMVGAFAVVVAGNDILFSRYLGNTFQSRTFVDVFQERMTTPADVTEYGVMAALAVIVTLCAVLAFSYLHSRVVERLAEAKHS